MKIKVGRDQQADPSRMTRSERRSARTPSSCRRKRRAHRARSPLYGRRVSADEGVADSRSPFHRRTSWPRGGETTARPPGCPSPAGEYGSASPILRADARRRRRPLLQADVTRCGGITGLIRIDGLCKARNLPFSAHCAPAVSAHAGCAMESVLHIEYFYDHERIERARVRRDARPLRRPPHSRPGTAGLGIELKRDEAARFAV